MDFPTPPPAPKLPFEPPETVSYVRNLVRLIYAVCAFAAVLHLRIGLNNDTMSLMHQTKKMLAGAKPYIDYIDVNPPLVNLIFAIPAIISHISGMPLYLALNLFALLVIAVVLRLSSIILRQASTLPSANSFTVSVIALALLGPSFMHQLFADREWLVVALISPLMLLYSPLVRQNNVSPRIRIIAALLAGIGFALKPYTLVIYAMVFCYRNFTGYPLSILLREAELYMIALVGFLYAVIIFAFFPEFLHTFMPIAADTYGVIGWDSSAKASIISGDLLGGFAVVGIVATGVVALAAPTYYHRLITYLFFLMIGAAGSYALSAGWYYTQYPFMVVGLLLAIAAASRLVSACQMIKSPPRQAVVVLSIGAVTMMGLWYYYASPAITQATWDLRLIRTTGKPINVTTVYPPAEEKIEPHLETHPRYLWLAINVWAPYLLKEKTPRESVGRFDYLWPLPGIIQLRGNKERKDDYIALVRWFSEAIADDIATHTPDMVINDISPNQRSLPTSYNVISLLTLNAKFAEVWKNYRHVDTIRECTDGGMQSNCAFEIYYRQK